MSLSEYLQQNYFELFQLPVTFEVEVESLKQTQQSFQKKIHPDNYVNASQQEQMLAMQVSTQVNTAYQVLCDDLQRAIYLLSLQGIDTNAETDTHMPMEFLMKQMEVREKLAEVNNDESGLTALDDIFAAVKQDRTKIVKELNHYFRDQHYTKARDSVRQFQFIDKLEREIKQKIASIEDALIG